MSTVPDLQLYARLWDPEYAHHHGGHNENWAVLRCPSCGAVATEDGNFHFRSYRIEYSYLVWEGPQTGTNGHITMGECYDSESTGEGITLHCGDCGSEVPFDGDIEID